MLPNTIEQDMQGRVAVEAAPDLNELLSALNVQVGGGHYKKLGQYQPWEVLARWLTPDELRGFAKGTMIAYLARERDKGGLQDISKAIHTGQLFEELLAKCVEFHKEQA